MVVSEAGRIWRTDGLVVFPSTGLVDRCHENPAYVAFALGTGGNAFVVAVGDVVAAVSDALP